MTEILFYMMALGTVGCATAALFVPQVIYGVLFLIGAFFNVSGLFLLLGAEFLAFVLIMLNVGAVALLFLFILMTLDVPTTKEQPTVFYKKPPIFIGGLLFIEMSVFLVARGQNLSLVKATQSNTHALGEVLYTHYVFPFQVMGVILLTAMIIAVGLLWEKRHGHKRQEHQGSVRASDRLILMNPDRGKGIKR